MTNVMVPVATLVLGILLTRLFDVYERRDRYRREDSVSMREHQKWIDQQWWQRKADTYSMILDTIWHEFNFASETIDYYLEWDRSAVHSPERDISWRERNKLLKSRAQLGGFYVSEEAAEALRDFFKDLAKIDYEDVMDPPEVHLSASKKCLVRIKAAAATDLGIRWERLSPISNDFEGSERLLRERNDP